jgi:hypothetical protein
LSRWLVFLAGLVAGVTGGLVYGWFVSPVQYTNASPAVLRADYRNDYVLMVAESYQADQDLGKAASELAELGQPDLAGLVRETLATDEAAGYASVDLERLKTLADRLARTPLLPPATP